MGYLHIENLYKDNTIMLFKECYALEKIHGTSAHIRWNAQEKKLAFYSGSEPHEKFLTLFNQQELKEAFASIFVDSNVMVYGEAYGGKQQGMSRTYGKELKFIPFDVKVNNMWVNVPNAHNICEKLNLEFVHYQKIDCTLEAINYEMNLPSAQAIRNGMGDNHIREGVVLRPLVEFTMNNGSRVICKHRRPEFIETKTPREVDAAQLQILSEAKEIAEEWVTEMRLAHVLDKLRILPENLSQKQLPQIITAMIEDVYREGKGEIVESKEAQKCIGNKTAALVFQKIKIYEQEHPPVPCAP